MIKTYQSINIFSGETLGKLGCLCDIVKHCLYYSMQLIEWDTKKGAKLWICEGNELENSVNWKIIRNNKGLIRYLLQNVKIKRFLLN